MNTYYGKDSSFSVYFIYGKNIEKGKSTYKKNTVKMHGQEHSHIYIQSKTKQKSTAVWQCFFKYIQVSI